MKLGSLFDGSGGFPLAARMCGIEPVWASEIEPYCIRVTKKNFPNMKHYGDITKINGAEIEPVDIITFGSPCQDLSIAGKRAGLDGERSGLFMEAVRVIKEMRNATKGKYPTFIIWENVYGAFNSNNGDDFWTVLNEIHGIAEKGVCVPRLEKWPKSGEILADGYSIAWRTLDAQFWGVPQMRRRIFLVADFRGDRAGEILFKRDGLSRNFGEIKKEGEETPPDIGTSLKDSSGEEKNKHVAYPIEGNGTRPSHRGQGLRDTDKMYTLNSTEHHGVVLMQGSSPDKGAPRVYDDKAPTLKTDGDTVGSNLMVFYNNGTAVSYAGPMEKSPTLLNRMGTGGNNTPFVVRGGATTYRKVSRARSKDDATTWAETDKANTINTFDLGEKRCAELVVENDE